MREYINSAGEGKPFIADCTNCLQKSTSMDCSTRRLPWQSCTKLFNPLELCETIRMGRRLLLYFVAAIAYLGCFEEYRNNLDDILKQWKSASSKKSSGPLGS